MLFGSVLVTVCFGVALVGFSAGLVGCVVSLRGRNLEADVMAHCTLPGLVLGVLVAHYLPISNAASPLLSMALGAVTAVAAIALMNIATRQAQRRWGLGPDAVQALTLGLGFGSSVVLLSLVQSLVPGQRAGLDRLLLGNAALITIEDVWIAMALCVALFGLFLLLSKRIERFLFDPLHWRLVGGSVRLAETLYAAVLFLVMLNGMRVVGVVLMVAFLTLPWIISRLLVPKNFEAQALAAAGVGAATGIVGTVASFWLVDANGRGLPTGPTIVLTMAAFLVALGFVQSLFRRKRPVGASG